MLSDTVVCQGTLLAAMFIALTACAVGSARTPDGQFKQIAGAQSLIEECHQKLGALRDDILQETCKVIENHITVMEARLQTLCKDAGETIHRTVDNVDGIYIQISEKDPNKVFRYYHEDDRLSHNYMSPSMGKHYTLWEMDSFRKEGVIDHHTLEAVIQEGRKVKWNGLHRELTKPEAAYGIRWKYVTRVEEQRQGLHGEELTVFDVKTQEVLATRKTFFYVVENGINDASGRTAIYMRVPMRGPYRFVACSNYNSGIDDGYIDQRPRHSYRFISKILRPKIMPDSIAVHVFDLARGSGKKTLDSFMNGCRTIGPRITPDDLQLSKVSNWDLRIAVRDTGDSLMCTSFFHPIRFDDEAQRAFVTLRFYDGTKWEAEDILNRIKQTREIHKPE